MEKSELLLYNIKRENSFDKSGTSAKWFFMTNSDASTLHNGLAKLIILTMKVNNPLWLTSTPILYLSFKIGFGDINAGI
ncbi:hypothetical protein HN189_002480 [Escherichia coli]|uniref:Uncharacterized protein n=1 Tax=Escherichia coli TaxID=562 RepID=A0A5B9ANZ8_ECOLX|nr:hypothetical protein [Escherichia coli]EFM2098322.1 hypothetical protein [Escherichia coli]EFM2136104.1 hypothetical protein [Escherichia coli]EFO7790706.1 hypothetical protein [Escherichia coli]EIF6361231.1 hypothetical protein [Escherichia coli]MBC0558425.1 hypothetical protein [Escherichia coli]